MTLEAGTVLTPYIVERVGADAMRLVAALMDDPNPIHFDRRAPAEIGLGDRLVNQGPITMGYVLAMVMQNLGPSGRIVSSNARFLGNVFEGDRVECSGQVSSVDPSDCTATLSCRATINATDVLTLTATVALNNRQNH